MAQTLLKLSKEEDTVVNLVKAKFSLKNKNAAIKQILQEYKDELLDKDLKSDSKSLKTSLNPKGEELKSLDEFEENLGYA